MKVLILNGSPRKNGNTSIAVNELVKTFQEEGVETEVCQIGNKDIRGCIACGTCFKTGKCVFDDIVNSVSYPVSSSSSSSGCSSCGGGCSSCGGGCSSCGGGGSW